MRDFEEHIELDAVGGTVDMLVCADPEGVQLSITDPQGDMISFAMTPKEARHLASCLVSACLPDIA